VNEVFIEFAKSVITATERLDIIRGGDNSSLPELPSWVPDWKIQRSGKPSTVNYKAHGRSKAKVDFPSNGNVLCSKGVIFDVVDGLGCAEATAGGRVSDCQTKLSQLVESGNPYRDSADAREALWKTLVGGELPRQNIYRMIGA